MKARLVAVLVLCLGFSHAAPHLHQHEVSSRKLVMGLMQMLPDSISSTSRTTVYEQKINHSDRKLQGSSYVGPALQGAGQWGEKGNQVKVNLGFDASLERC
eukprot:TRINITY_DN23429_c0_g1_i1.p1 TRINITY_DN23429_c0_g1~~TRINITY_DN23429_c0_g1_i1.p1  ORF type:complete len:101 (-),score=22.09 TRINITY_DN23429_c0_g1_i1:185-487(-)